MVSVRIVAGRMKGRRLLGPAGGPIGPTRPTSGRVRKSLFDMLAAWIRNRTVVDLCAGIGSLGIEALSRGAACAVFVDRDVRAVRTIRRNLTLCRLTARSAVWRAGAVAALRHLAGASCRVDLILADPPYDSPAVHEIVRTVGTVSVLNEGGLFVLEHRRDISPDVPGAGLTRVRRRDLGDTALTLYQADRPPPALSSPFDRPPALLPPPSRRVRS